MQVRARDDFVATAAYLPEPAAAAAARRFVRETLLSWPLPGRPARQDTLIDDAVLLTSELVTNAVVHAGTSVHVTCSLTDGAVEVVVLDGRPAQLIPDRPRVAADPAERTSGRGLQFPAELASAWGVTYARAAKAVWFRIGLPGFGAGAGTGARSTAAVLADDRVGQPGMLAGTPATADSVPAWPRRNLSRLGYEELLSSTAEAGRAAVAADIAYLLDAGEDGELRVRAVAGMGPARLAALGRGGAGRASPGPESPRPAGSGQLNSDPQNSGQEIPGPESPGPDSSGPESSGPVHSWRLSSGSRNSDRGGSVRALAGAALSLITVPLVVDGRVTGVLAVAAADPDRFGEQDAARLQDFADWSAPALERARLGELEHVRRQRADFLAEASEELSASLDEAEIAVAGARLALSQLARWCAVLVADEGRPMRLVHATHADGSRIRGLEWLLQRVDPPAVPAAERPGRGRRSGWRWQLELPAGPGRSRPPRSHPHPLRPQGGKPGQRGRSDGPESAPVGVAELAADHAWCFPLDAADRTLGLLVMGGPGEHWPPREARELAGGLARRIAVALDSAGRRTPDRASAAGQPAAGQPSAEQPPARRATPYRDPASQAPADHAAARQEPAR